MNIPGPGRFQTYFGTTLFVLAVFLLGAIGVRANTPDQVIPSWEPDVRANSDDSGWSQHEPHLAISRVNPYVMVAVAKDYRRINTKEVWIYVSQDGGKSWPLNKQLRVPGLPSDIDEQSDPVVVARDDGRFYVVCLGVGSNGSHGLFITWSDDDGDSWQDAVSITYNETPGSLDDKEWLAIDNNPLSPHYHHMYAAWSDPYGLGVLFSRSIDGGLTWSPYLDIHPGASTEYAYPVVAPDGDLYLFYMHGWGYCADGWIRYVRSSDGGQTFSAPQAVVETHQPCSPIHGVSGYDQWRFFSIIAAIADPNDPDSLWVAWTDDYNISNGQTDVLYVRTTDGGGTWSAADRLSHDTPGTGRDHITPVLAISADSRLHAFWLDRRDDPANHLFHGYHSSTTDGGLTWEPDSRVSDEAFDLNTGFPPPSGYNAAGDYWGLDVVGDIVAAAWNTTVRGEQDIYLSRGFMTHTVDLTGQVRDGVTLAPIAGAQVSIALGPMLFTDASGIYTTTLLPGTYTVTAQAAGYISQTVSPLPVLTGTVVQDFDLQPLVCITPSIQAVGVFTDNLTATFSATILGTRPISYWWTLDEGVTSTLESPTHVYTDYGVYTITLEVMNPCGSDAWLGQVSLVETIRRIYLPVIFRQAER